ncbi:Knotted-like MEINOX transcription factor [Parasponia andersonii]|uniref:Knotted-like MEINOX transcription factor n=1 Tax=Parasponia andersonii TaxID=3476 RepID=A0A2P5E180_PARAD|nr:Knotted-like MEINOX transcription factor [Parasponia andersonii]
MEPMSCEISKEEVKETGEELVDDEENGILKMRISSHHSYRLLLESHVDCLKAGGIGEVEIMNIESRYLKQQGTKTSSSRRRKLELDQFMRALLDLKRFFFSKFFSDFIESVLSQRSYCLALTKLKEAIEEPQQKSMAFINSMHSQLTQITSSTNGHLSSERASYCSSP